MSFENFDWASSEAASVIAQMPEDCGAQCRQIARAFDWSIPSEAAMGCLMARRQIDLDTALAVFFNGDPARFNYVAKKSVGEEHLPALRLLDNICRRINAGFYLYDPEAPVTQGARLEKWLANQAQDESEKARGRFIIERAVLEPLLSGGLRFVSTVEPLPQTLMRRLFGQWMR